MIERIVQRRVDAALEERGLTDLLLAGIEATVAGSAGNVASTGALETAAGIWGRTLAAASVEGTGALTPAIRHLIGRCLIREGEIVFLIEVDGGRVMLTPASSFEVQAGWRYRVEVTVPPGKSVTRNVPRDEVLHFQWATHPREPWRGISPLGQALLLGKIAAQTDTKLLEELATPTAHILPVPFPGDSPQATGLRTDVASAKGAAILLEGTKGSPEETHRGTDKDWQARRLGPAIPTELRVLFSDVASAVAQACGIPNSLVTFDNVDGTEVREAYRRFIMQSVEPIADMIATEASEKLDAGVEFDFTGLWAHDLAGRAAAFQKLVAGGMDPAKAAGVTGLMEV